MSAERPKKKASLESGITVGKTARDSVQTFAQEHRVKGQKLTQSELEQLRNSVVTALKARANR